MTKYHYVVDTGYLLEFFKVTGHFNEGKHKRVAEKFKQAAKEGFPVYVPVLVLFEVANHIAQVADGSYRKQLAAKLTATVKNCLEKRDPWIISPSKELEADNRLLETLLKFSTEYSQAKIGLTDAAVASEALRLAEKYKSFGHKIHIWTTDQALKAREPDTEQNPFV
jgi:predicted nucleic acid-binding protein